jgi:hypothetical protein
MINIVTLDPSLISTALIVSNGETFKMFNYCRNSSVYSKKDMTKWFKMAKEHITYKSIEFREFDNYSDGELIKLKDYDKITDDIISDILENINPKLPIKIGIEGYSFSSKNGDIIDLVTFSTILRKKLYDKVSQDILVVSPTTLKLESCKITYKPIDIGKKKPNLVYKNNDGIAGGSFKKTEIFKAIIENDNFDDYWTEHCKSVQKDVLSTKEIKKPYEDCNDAFMLYKIILANKLI